MKIIMTNPEKGYEVLCMVREDQSIMLNYYDMCEGLKDVSDLKSPTQYTIVDSEAYLCEEGRLWINPDCHVRRGSTQDYPLDPEEKYVQWINDAVKILKAKLVSPKSYLNMLVIPKYFKEPVKITDDGMWNATNMAVQCGKCVSDWLNEKSTIKVIKVFMDRYGMPQDRLVKAVRDGRDGNVPGLWLGDRIVLEFCRWLDVNLSVAIDSAMMNVLHKASGTAEDTLVQFMNDQLSKGLLA